MALNDFQGMRVAKAIYDFSVDGGAMTTIVPSTTEVVPKNAIITDVKLVSVTGATTGTSATIALTAGGVTIKAAESPSNAVLNGGSNAIVDVIRSGNTGSTGTAKYVPILTTSSDYIKVVIGTGTLTAGKFYVYVYYVMLPPTI